MGWTDDNLVATQCVYLYEVDHDYIPEVAKIAASQDVIFGPVEVSMPGFSIVPHKGKEVVFYDMSQATEEEMVAVMAAGSAYSQGVDQTRKYPVLIDVTGSFATPAVTEKLQELTKEHGHLVYRSAIVGLDSVAKKILLRSFNILFGDAKTARPFSSREEAMDYVVS